jgi:hypothetical protein
LENEVLIPQIETEKDTEREILLRIIRATIASRYDSDSSDNLHVTVKIRSVFLNSWSLRLKEEHSNRD